MTGLPAVVSFGPEGWGDELFYGAWVTLTLALAALPAGLAIGLGVALLQESRSRVTRALGALYATVFRGLPELLTIFIVYFGLPRLVNRLVALAEQALGLPPSGFAAGIDAFSAGAVALALVVGAFSSEVFLGALRGVDRGQREAADALGMTPFCAFRLVTLPQALRLALPGLANNWLVLLKDTSLVSVIALADLMRQSNLAAIATKQPLAVYGLACLIYLALSGASTLVAGRLEARANRGLGAR